MPTMRMNGVEIAYERDGAPDAPAILAIMGVSEQLIHWPREFYQPLVELGYQVIRFDNRDTGLSTHFGESGSINIKKLLLLKLLGFRVAVPYTVDEMAEDAHGLLDGLGIRSAHIVGVSLGGIIAQVLTANHPDCVASLTLISTTSDSPKLPKPSIKAMKKMMSPGGASDRESAIHHKLEVENFIGSPAYPEVPAVLRARAEQAYDRMYYPEGTTRQLAAALTYGSRVNLLKALDVPALVIHGTEDPLFPVVCARDIARHLAGSKLEVIEGMGHGMSSSLMAVWIKYMAPHFQGSNPVESGAV